MALIRLVVIGFVILSVIYFALSIYSRSVRRERLEKDWAEENPGSTDMDARDAAVEAGMADYEKGLRPKLLILVYLIPTILVIAALVVTNTN